MKGRWIRRMLSVSYSYHGLLLTSSSFMLSRQMDPYLVDIFSIISMTTHVFLLHVTMIDTYMIIIIMCFTATIMVHDLMASVVCTFVHSYRLLLLPIVSLGFHESDYKARGCLTLQHYQEHHGRLIKVMRMCREFIYDL